MTLQILDVAGLGALKGAGWWAGDQGPVGQPGTGGEDQRARGFETALVEITRVGIVVEQDVIVGVWDLNGQDIGAIGVAFVHGGHGLQQAVLPGNSMLGNDGEEANEQQRSGDGAGSTGADDGATIAKRLSKQHGAAGADQV